MSKTLLNLSTAICIIPLNIFLRPNTNFSIRQTLLWFFCVGIGQSGHHRGGRGAQKEAFFPLWGQRRKFSSLASTPDRVRESFCLGPSSKKRGLRMRHVCSAPQLGKKLIGFDASSPLLFLMVLWVTENRMHIRMKQTREKKGKDLLFRTCTGKTFFFGLGRRELETNNFPTWFSLASCCIPAPTPKKVFVQSCY